MRPLVSVSIVTWNSREYLERCLTAALAQTYAGVEVLVIDNASTDGSPELVRCRFGDRARVIRSSRNLGYAGGHNLGIAESRGEYVLLANPDVCLHPEYVARLIESMREHPRVGMAQGKLLAGVPPDGSGAGPCTIDSTGLVLTRARRCYDRGNGEADRGQFGTRGAIFGPTGAAAIYRRSMLEEVRLGDDYFDSDFFCYREDADLAWRAQQQGWTGLYEPTAIAYHIRRYSPVTRRDLPRQLRVLMYRNRYLMLVKNESVAHVLRDAIPFLAFELVQAAYVALREPHLILGLGQMVRLLPAALAKRRVIRRRRSVPDAVLRALIT